MLGTHARSAARCVTRRVVWLSYSHLLIEFGLVFKHTGLSEEDGRWNLVLQSMQEDYCWRSMDCINNRCCYRSQVRVNSLHKIR
jgi:hypothetical protein